LWMSFFVSFSKEPFWVGNFIPGNTSAKGF
jgi:hypothetical protein